MAQAVLDYITHGTRRRDVLAGLPAVAVLPVVAPAPAGRLDRLRRLRRDAAAALSLREARRRLPGGWSASPLTARLDEQVARATARYRAEAERAIRAPGGGWAGLTLLAEVADFRGPGGDFAQLTTRAGCALLDAVRAGGR